MNYFEDRMPNFHFRFHEVPVRERNYDNNQIEFNIMHNNLYIYIYIYIKLYCKQMKGEVRISLLQ